MEISLDPEVERVIRLKVDRGEYSSIIELVEEALFLLVERDWVRSQAELQEKMPSAFNFDPQVSTEGDQS